MELFFVSKEIAAIIGFVGLAIGAIGLVRKEKHEND
jgi:hypothetical protein